MAYILEKIGNTYNLPKKYFTCDAKSDLDGISLVDVPIGSEAYCILEEESYILDSNKQWHKKKIGEDLTGQVQADLSQTDSTQADYVKGVLRTEHLPEGYPYKGIKTILDGTFEFIDNRGIYMYQITDENFTYVDGNSYTVIWDGEAYQCVATIFNDSLVLGNLAVAGVPDSDTGEPFVFGIMGTNKFIYTTDTAATHTITVRGEVAYPIAPEFLPEGYPYKKKDEILPETVVQIETANEAVNIPFIVNFTAGSLYKVIWDGITYEVVAANIQGATAIGNAALANKGDDTGEPFLIASVDGETILFAETAGSHTISIIVETIHPIATEFLPTYIATKSEVEAAKTTAENAQTTAENAQTTAENAQTTAENAQTTANTAKTTAENAQTTAKNAQTTANTAKTTANTAKTTANTAKTTANTAKTTAENAQTTAENAQTTANTAKTTASEVQTKVAKALTIDSSGHINIPTNAMNDGTFQSLQLNSKSGGFPSSFSVTPSTGLKITVIRDGGANGPVSNPSTVEFIANGSTCMRLKGIDELIMNSSTASSTKKFKITIDDSGTLLTTEVTD